MGQETLNGVDISELRAAYDRKVGEELPARATDDWPIRADHCFARVVLDNVFGGPWYDHVTGRPAYERLSVAELEAAIDIADEMLVEGQPAVETYNQKSLGWRDER